MLVAVRATTVLAVLVAVITIFLQLRHSRFRDIGQRSAGWPWTLGTQAVLCFVANPMFEVVSTVFLAFLSGSILLLIERPVRASATDKLGARNLIDAVIIASQQGWL